MKTNEQIQNECFNVVMMWAAGFGILMIALGLLLSGCTMVSNDRVFPKLTWYWSKEAKQQRAERAHSKPTINNPQSRWIFPVKDTGPYSIDTNLVNNAVKNNGTNILGIYLGMIALYNTGTNGEGGVGMFSATTGEMLRLISYDEFKAVYVDKTKPEYPASK